MRRHLAGVHRLSRAGSGLRRSALGFGAASSASGVGQGMGAPPGSGNSLAAIAWIAFDVRDERRAVLGPARLDQRVADDRPGHGVVVDLVDDGRELGQPLDRDVGRDRLADRVEQAGQLPQQAAAASVTASRSATRICCWRPARVKSLSPAALRARA